ncbi:MAG: hypothetical protein ACYC2I_13325 [Elusimicrobiales bacterium]
MQQCSGLFLLAFYIIVVIFIMIAMTNSTFAAKILVLCSLTAIFPMIITGGLLFMTGVPDHYWLFDAVFFFPGLTALFGAEAAKHKSDKDIFGNKDRYYVVFWSIAGGVSGAISLYALVSFYSLG